jgi:prophage regulatory protein
MSMRFIRFKELRQRIPLGRTTIWKMMREGRFPQSRRIGKMAAAWLESEVEDWMKKNAGIQEGQPKEHQYEQVRAV